MTVVRKSNVTFDRWTDFRAAVRQMLQNPPYRRLAAIHAEQNVANDGFIGPKHRMHSGPYGVTGTRRFLPWHRVYLLQFERELRAIDDTLSLPYWDWDNDQGRLVGVRNFLAAAVTRDLGLPSGVATTNVNQRAWFSSEPLTEFFETFTGDYFDFSRALETGVQTPSGPIVGQHGSGHVWVGGEMANIRFSPNDILFWMHHAAIDRIWAKWQIVNPGEKADITGKEARLDPWSNEFNVESINDISALGADSYTYEDPVRPAPVITPLFT